MSVFTSVNDPQIVELLGNGGIGVLRTDTLYGVVADARNEAAVMRVYDVKGRDQQKSPIVLVSELSQLFDEPDQTVKKLLSSVWPGPVSVIVPSTAAPDWIRRGNGSVAYRQPANDELMRLLATTGALIAPSANPEGLSPAMNVDQAIAYFGDTVDFYVDGGEVIDPTPSTLLRVNPDGTTDRLR